MLDWTHEELAIGTGGTWVTDARPSATGFSIDTRTLAPGDAFFAIRGERFDGHDFLPQAVQKGASVLIGSRFPASLLAMKPTVEEILPTLDGRSPPALPEPPGFLQVDDPLLALQRLARFHRARHPGLFLGVTGSNGKTTTKEMLRHLFSSVAETRATSGNLNNHIGLPLELVRLPLSTRVAVIEMGMNHAGEIRFLASLARPTAAVITNIGPAHIGNLGSLENIAHAKAEILEELPPSGTAVVDGDSKFLPIFRAATRARVATFGVGPDCDLRALDLTSGPDGSRMRVAWHGQEAEVHLSLLGRHNALNALAALALFVSQGHDLATGAARLARFAPVGARMESHVIEGRRIILDCYNANPASMAQAIEFLRQCPGQRLAVLGDMRELGADTARFHTELGAQVARAGIDRLIAVGHDAAAIAEGARQAGMPHESIHHCEDTIQAIRLLPNLLTAGQTVLLKASRGMHFETIVKALWPTLPVDLH
ncbi:MAG: UDP-N-acetylmuramoylalanyl-D-glutamyl-2,6-diaminopimelate--D-alanyl-D-alanine ligase [Candidatus Ozemobacter sibiricus]|jgi:UDP-N-acetylmuramoyl-tripeptide--D-alanyl-D-alanine ligase|uniref:UDP-N-acetylmuramoyl-tripeptide--D-alanyl-D-alanine ligase n=1 Tax=Candidatus Ozemobacter sibiricus TaxID=2268124 RepID=A0A367ZVF0_9BACT|nr:MAG: UDP-N-acetylmuramoylalanyl-D-glutamyl-2,6-diaminopimelate--D-alanyl-D-alanine ligase [Candidatus Ozemobacter sibiricus]